MREYSRIKIYMPLLFCFLFINHTLSAQFLNVGVVQMNKKPDLMANKNTILKYIGEAKNQGCDLVVFPEEALGCDICARDSVYIKRLDSAIEEIKNAVRKNQIYTVLCVQNLLKAGDRFRNRMYVIDGNGEIIKTYDKLWDHNKTLPSGTIAVKGIPVGLTICADRWLRTTTDLPLMHAPVSIECSWSKLDTVYFPYGPIEGIHWWEIQTPDSTFLDCSPTKGPYWIPRAMRNDAYIICAGRRASIVDPNGKAYHCPDKTEQLLVKQIDVSARKRTHAQARFDHPVFQPWWELGTKLLNGEKVENTEPEILVSEPRELTIALAQIAVSDHIDENLKIIEQNIKEAKTGNADLVVFPALSVTGKPQTQSDIHSAAIESAIYEISTWAKRYGIYVIVGSAWKENEDIFNAAFVIDDEGKLMTRYDQLSADNTIFTPGKSTRAMWFNVKNVHGVVTVGNDLCWEEIAELSACKGAQLLINVANNNFGEYEEYFKQSFATFNTFTVIVNAAEDHEMSASGKSRVFNDLRRPKAKYHADLIVEADGQPGLFLVNEKMESVNPWFDKIKKLNRAMIPWFNYGVHTIYKAPPITHVMEVEN